MGLMTEMTCCNGEESEVKYRGRPGGVREAGKRMKEAGDPVAAIDLSVAEITGISETMVQLLDRVELLPGDSSGYDPALSALLTVKNLLGECERRGHPQHLLMMRAMRAEARLFNQVYPDRTDRGAAAVLQACGQAAQKEPERAPLSISDFPELTAALMEMGTLVSAAGQLDDRSAA